MAMKPLTTWNSLSIAPQHNNRPAFFFPAPRVSFAPPPPLAPRALSSARQMVHHPRRPSTPRRVVRRMAPKKEKKKTQYGTEYTPGDVESGDGNTLGDDASFNP